MCRAVDSGRPTENKEAFQRMPEPTDQTDLDQLEQDDAIIGVAFRWSLVVIGVIVVGVGLYLYSNRPRKEPSVVIERPPVAAPESLAQGHSEMPSVRFTDITRAAGIDFVRFNGARGEKLLPETMGGGAAFLDFDNDGDQDLLLVNGTDWPHDAPSSPLATNALYANDGRGNFTDVTIGSGLDVALQGMGVACADYDGDGWTDVYITALGVNHLYRNTGGKFVDVTDHSGAGGGDEWSTSAGFLDYDRDGDLDLFVCNYIHWSREIDLQLSFTLNGTDRAYGPPTQYEGATCTLLRNDGDGTFSDVTEASGIAVLNPATGKPMGKALAVTYVDIDRDGYLDIIVANDTVQNFVFHNRGGERFEEVGSATGIGFDSMGGATGAMGMDVGNVFTDERIAIAIANFANEASSFYVQQPRSVMQFADMSGSQGIGSPSRLKLSFGLFFFDYDLDGRLDLLQANGHLEDEIHEIQESQHFRQPAQLFWNCGPTAKSCYAVVPEESVGDLSTPIVGRGSTYADIDGDGDLDVVLMQSVGPPVLLRNDQELGHHWVRLKLLGRGLNRDAIGARVELVSSESIIRRVVMPTRSYLSQVELPITIGLGNRGEIESIRIIWPDGSIQQVTEALPGVTTVIRQEQPTP